MGAENTYKVIKDWFKQNVKYKITFSGNYITGFGTAI